MPATMLMTNHTEGPHDKRITLALSDRLWGMVDTYIDDLKKRAPGSRRISQNEAVRRLIVAGLIKERYLPNEINDDMI